MPVPHSCAGSRRWPGADLVLPRLPFEQLAPDPADLVPSHVVQLRWVKQSLQSVRYHGWKAGRQAAAGGTARDALQHQASWPWCSVGTVMVWMVNAGTFWDGPIRWTGPEG